MGLNRTAPLSLHRAWRLTAGVALLALLSAPAALAQTRAFNIPAGDAQTALVQFARQARVQIIAPGNELLGVRTPAIQGAKDARAALRELIRGTPLEIASDNGSIITLRRRASPPSRPQAPARRPPAPPPRPASADSLLLEVIVTAQKRDERLQDVPASVAVISGGRLRAAAASNYVDYLSAIPSVSYARNGAFKDKIFIRGLSDSMSSRVAPTTSLYLDETPITEVDAALGDFGTFDIERLEVLRGPQGTLFGSGSMGGTVRVITSKPRLDRYDAQAEARAWLVAHGGTGTELSGMVNIPLVMDRLAVRLSGTHRSEPGFIDNLVDSAKDINDTTADGVRLQALAQPSDNLKVLLAFQYQKTATNHGPYQDIGLPTYTVARYYPEVHRFTTRLYNATIIYDLPTATLTSVTSYIHKQNFSARDLTNLFRDEFQATSGLTSPELGIGLLYRYPNKAFVQEIRVASKPPGPVQWVVGAYYNNFYPTVSQTAESTLAPPPGFNFTTSVMRSHRRETAAFAEVSYDLAEQLRLTGGLRVATFGIGLNGYQDGVRNGDVTTIIDPPNLRQTKAVAKIRLDYRFKPNGMVYALASQGYRPGGQSGPFQPSCTAELVALGYPPAGPTAFQPDKLWNYEVGTKNQLFERRLTLNAAAYYIDWRETQVSQMLRSCGNQFISNAGGARVKGVEVEARAKPAPDLEVGVGLAYMESTFTRTDLTIRTREGAALPHAPRWTFNLEAQYEWDLGAGADAYAFADYHYVSGRYSDLPLLTSSHYQPAYAILNARLGLRRASWDVSLFAKNLADTVAVLNTTDGSGLYLQSISPPRTVGVELKRRF